MTHFTQVVVGAALALGGCFFGGDGPDLDAPPINPAITDARGEIAPSDPLGVTCVGPEDELAMLGALCGVELSSYDYVTFTAVSGGYGMGATLRPRGVGSSLMLFVEAPESDITELSHSAYVHLSGYSSPAEWPGAEPVLEGDVLTQAATFDSCSGNTWVGVATLLWRHTTIRAHFSLSGRGC